MTVEFVSARYLEMAAARPGLITRSRPVKIERRDYARRALTRRLIEHMSDGNAAIERLSIESLLRAAFPDCP